MNLSLGLRTLALLALVAAMTAVIVKPELMPGSADAPHAHGFTTLVALAHA